MTAWLLIAASGPSTASRVALTVILAVVMIVFIMRNARYWWRR